MPDVRGRLSKTAYTRTHHGHEYVQAEADLALAFCGGMGLNHHNMMIQSHPGPNRPYYGRFGPERKGGKIVGAKNSASSRINLKKFDSSREEICCFLGWKALEPDGRVSFPELPNY